PTWLAVWMPNIFFGVVGCWMFVRRLRGPGRPRRLAAAIRRGLIDPLLSRASTSHVSGIVGIPVPVMDLLDRYLALRYLQILALSILALIGVFYLSTFIDLSDEVLRGDATWGQLGRHLLYGTPQDLYYVLPMSVLLATLVTIGVLTKNSELVVMKACG